jgi:hypothetical protein
MPRKLKVFRAPIGFDDAYVAAPSRKAALAAWGSDADLFARGVAEEVTEAALMAAPLAEPGKVIRVSRGDLAAQLKALGPRRRKAKAEDPTAGPNAARPKRKPARPRSPPKRDKLDAAEAALDAARAGHDEEMTALETEREAVGRRIEALRARQDKEATRLERARDAARAAYRAALDKWSG